MAGAGQAGLASSVEWERFIVAVEGTLDAFALGDVLRLLAATAKSGLLSVNGDRGHATVQIVDGRLVAARSDGVDDGAPTDEVVFELLRFTRGSFRFSDEEPPPELAGEPEEIEAVLERAVAMLEEWHELEAVVPSPQHRVRLANQLPADEVTIDHQRWRILVTAVTSRSAGQLGTSLGLGELATARLVRDLVELGVVDVDPPGQRSKRGPSSARSKPSTPRRR